MAKVYSETELNIEKSRSRNGGIVIGAVGMLGLIFLGSALDRQHEAEHKQYNGLDGNITVNVPAQRVYFSLSEKFGTVVDLKSNRISDALLKKGYDENTEPKTDTVYSNVRAFASATDEASQKKIATAGQYLAKAKEDLASKKR